MRYILTAFFVSFFLFSCDGNSSKSDDDLVDNDLVIVDDATDDKNVVDEVSESDNMTDLEIDE